MTAATQKPANPLLELAVTLIIPSLILMQLSGPDNLGVINALLLALALPLAWGLRDLAKNRKFNLFAGLGLVSILLTGGIGLLQLDPAWVAVKEAAVPGIIGLAVLVSAATPYPLVRVLLYNRAALDVERVRAALAARDTTAAFERRLRRATGLLAGSFLFSSVMNYLLASWMVTSPAGSEAFNAELGKLALWSYPFIALPATLLMLGILFYLVRGIRALTGLELGDILAAAR